MATQEEIIRIKFEGVETVHKYTNAIIENQKEAERLKQINKNLKSTGRENSEQFIKNASDIRVLNKQQSENKRVVDQMNRANKANTGSITEQRARLSQLKTQYINLSKAERENKKVGGALQKEIHGITEELKKQEKAIGVTSRNVGNYEQSIMNAADSLGPFGKNINVVVSGLKKSIIAINGFKFGLKGMRAALVSTGIGALVVALGALITFLTTTKRGAESLQRGMAFLSAGFAVLRDAVSEFGEEVFKTLSEPKKMMQDFGAFMKVFLIDTFETLIKTSGFVGEAFSALFSGDFDKAKAAAKDAGKTLAEITPTLLVIEEQGGKTAESFKKLFDEIVREGQAAASLEERLQRLRDAERSLQIQQANRRTEINKLRQTVKDETKTFEERQVALEKAEQLQKVISDEELRIAKERVDIITKQLALGENLEEDEQQLADARTAQAEVEVERSKRNIKFITEQNLLNNQRIALESKLVGIRKKGLETATKLEKEFLAEIEKTRITGIEDDLQRSLAALDFKHDQEIQKITDKFSKVAELTQEEQARLDELDALEVTKKNQKDLEELERLKAKQAAQIAAEDEFNQLILEKDQAFLDAKTKLLNKQQVESLKLVQSMGESIGQEFINILNDQTKTAKDFMKFTIDLIIQTLEKQVLAAIAESQIKAAAKGPIGIVEAGLKIAAIKAIFAGARAGIARFAQGGLVEGGVFQGNSHAQGGVKFSSGGRVMEAEGGEAIINKRSTAMYKPLLSAINQIGGGKRFAQGGLTPILSQDLTNPLLSLSLSNQSLSSEISEIISSRINELRVINVVSDTTNKQISINNVESEALF